MKNARLITSPEERSLALQRIANGAIASRQLFLAHQMLEEAITATSEVTMPLVRDQRLIAIVTSMTALTDAMLLQGRQERSVIDFESGRVPSRSSQFPCRIPNPRLRHVPDARPP